MPSRALLRAPTPHPTTTRRLSRQVFVSLSHKGRGAARPSFVNDCDKLADQVARAMLAAEGAGPAWGVEMEEAREGYARVRMKVRADMLNGHGTAHGGMIFALADSAFAYACNARNMKSVAAYASIAFLDAAREGEVLV